jgi:hypothetical protein
MPVAGDHGPGDAHEPNDARDTGDRRSSTATDSPVTDERYRWVALCNTTAAVFM